MQATLPKHTRFEPCYLPLAEEQLSKQARRRLRIGVIGAGARGETFARQLFADNPHGELSGVCDTNEERLSTFCEYCRLGETPRYSSPADFLSRPEMDAVIITTPEWTHADIAVAALRAGKHIYLEKPMAHTSSECRRILAAHREYANVTAFIGFNMRETAPYRRLKQIVDSGVLGQIVQILGLEQLSRAHGAAFMRRFHRRSEYSGGLLNHKCSHDLDLMQWLIGHQHKIVKVSSFGGCNVFTPDKQPAPRCRDCTRRGECPYRDTSGFVFPIASQPLHHRETEIYGGDLCVFNGDKDIVDNQTVIMEWDNGVRGNFNLQMFQHAGRRQMCIWGERGYVELNTWPQAAIRVVDARTGAVTEERFEDEPGHGGSDRRMIGRFVEAIKNSAPSNSQSESDLSAGLAATLVAEKADTARLTESVVAITTEEYDICHA